MTSRNLLEDRLAITHVIQQVARNFDEKLHDGLARAGDQWRISAPKDLCHYAEGDVLTGGVSLYPPLPDLDFGAIN